jgi:flagellar hook protein FlgE
MTLFGALSSGVSGLTAQSSAIGAISDNITNVSTIGYKNTQVDFQTLVTKQTSATFFSAGGVQSRPRQDTGVQGLLASSASQTDIAISGSGYFVVNEAAAPTINNEFLYTRAGAFFQDNDGFLRNTAGYYLQAWPTDAAGVVVPANQNLTIPNQNVISTDFLTTVNLNRVGGTAAATTTIAIGANLPSNDSAGTTRKTDVQFFDTLGNATTMSLVNTKSNVDNQWDLTINPPPGTSVITVEDSAGLNYASIGQLEFKSRAADGAIVAIDSVNYEFDSTSISRLNTGTLTFDTTANTITSTSVATGGEFAGFKAGDKVTLAGTASNNTTLTIVSISADGNTATFGAGTLVAEAAILAGNVQLTYAGFTETATRRRVNVASNTTIAQDVATFISVVIAFDTDFDSTNNRIKVDPGNSTTVLFTEDGTGAMTIDPSGLLTTSGTPAANQDTSFTVKKVNAKYAETTQLTFATTPAQGETITINGVTYTFSTAEDTAGGFNADTTIRVDTVANMLQDLEESIEANDPQFPQGGSALRVRAANNNATNNTLVIPSLASGSFNISFSAAFSALPTEPDGTATFSSTSATAVSTAYAIVFNSDGIPAAFNVDKLEILNFANGSSDMNDDPAQSPKISLDLGTVGEANGFTQFGGSFTPVFITQNGSQFGTFAGVTVAANGLVTALFDNGETRPVFQLPLATFVNVNALGSRSGNVWNATQQSGDPTLRVADNGPAGQIVQGSLEQSTVDIGTEFTKMIVVQRAFSAAAKIITTADEMLDELIRTKR